MYYVLKILPYLSSTRNRNSRERGKEEEGEKGGKLQEGAFAAVA